MTRTDKIKELHDEDILNLASDTIEKGKQALVFISTKASTEATAEKIAKKLEEKAELIEISENILHALPRPTRQCKRLAKVARKGVVFHHAGLNAKQRDIIEDSFRDGTIRIICCTPTLAAGVDLPAFRTILKDLRRYNGRWGYAWIPNLEYQQMSGRAGRPGKEDFGEAIAIASTEKEKQDIYERYVIGEVEPVYSKLAVEPVLRTYALSLVATEIVNSSKELIDFFSNTFWARQYKDMNKLAGKILQMTEMLKDFGFIGSKSSEFVSASELEDEELKATPLGKRVAQLYIDPVTAHNIILGLKKSGKNPSAFSILQLITSQLEMRPRLRLRKSDYDKVNQKLVEEELIVNEPDVYDPEHDDFLDSVKTAMFFEDWIEENTEEELLERYNIRPGEIKTKIDNADWLLYASEEIAKIIEKQEIVKELRKIRIRVINGVKEDILPLLQIKHIGRVRARKLFSNKIRDLKGLREISITALSQIIGAKTAASVKEQLGEKVKVVPEKRRKGQMSLSKYKE